jgi:biopolymer transport protein ExbD/biopolymer transport protein TolR
VYIRADQRARYGIVMDAIDNLRTAGVDEVAFLTEPQQTTPPPPPANQKNPPPPASGS